jgi:hypothetical protein
VRVMQAYVHKDGKNLGPYTVRELRSRVEDGSLDREDLACHDGQNWVKISQIPGFESSIPPSPPPSSGPPPIGGTPDQPSAAERAKSLAGNLFKKSKESVEKLASSEKVSQLKEKASDVTSRIAASDQVKQAKKKASDAKSKITSSEKFRSLKDKFKFKSDDKE